jgi:hypothetical protein
VQTTSLHRLFTFFKEMTMKIIKLNAVVAGMLSAGALLAVAPGVSSAAFEDGLDMHGWRIEQPQVMASSLVNGENGLDIHGWRIEQAQVTASNQVNGENGLDIHGWRIEQAQVAAVDSPYIGTSLRVDANGEPGFTDPRPGQNDLESGDGTMGFADPRPGQGDY